MTKPKTKTDQKYFVVNEDTNEIEGPLTTTEIKEYIETILRTSQLDITYITDIADKVELYTKNIDSISLYPALEPVPIKVTAKMRLNIEGLPKSIPINIQD